MNALLATGWAISAGERYLVGNASFNEVQAACDAAYGAFSELMERQRPYAAPVAHSMNLKARAASSAAVFAYAVWKQLPDSFIEGRLEAARDAFKAAYP